MGIKICHVVSLAKVNSQKLHMGEKKGKEGPTEI